MVLDCADDPNVMLGSPQWNDLDAVFDDMHANLLPTNNAMVLGAGNHSNARPLYSCKLFTQSDSCIISDRDWHTKAESAL